MGYRLKSTHHLRRTLSVLLERHECQCHENASEHVPLGFHRTTFTAAECLLSVARYSTLGGRGVVASVSASSNTDGGMMFGCTNHNYAQWSMYQRIHHCRMSLKLTLTWLSSPPVASL